jgi:hypothetical protein
MKLVSAFEVKLQLTKQDRFRVGFEVLTAEYCYLLGYIRVFLKLALARSNPALPIGSPGKPDEEGQRANESRRTSLPRTL